MRENMACRFCPKIKKYDVIWVAFVCVAMWGVNKYQTYKIEQREQKEFREFELLQKKCLYGDDEACKNLHQKQ
ncbi:hypothetical protein [Helicobacter anatolicus]|uniref:hypothetical protein n=1 Tax=Helicobacter anatolicus TaxID=2905874 RepID=UPI001E373983|nr:hypothetical protein [Helicobacter anatolicus]MCE3039273.1 hypothetical protein [Helicobacter anatolicus]